MSFNLLLLKTTGKIPRLFMLNSFGLKEDCNIMLEGADVRQCPARGKDRDIGQAYRRQSRENLKIVFDLD
jgi:hypothetical protein